MVRSSQCVYGLAARPPMRATASQMRGSRRRSRLTRTSVHTRSEEHTAELQSRFDVVCRLLLEKKTMITLALVRFPPTASIEIQYLNATGALTYTDIAVDPVFSGILPLRELHMKDFLCSGDSSM